MPTARPLPAPGRRPLGAIGTGRLLWRLELATREARRPEGTRTSPLSVARPRRLKRSGRAVVLWAVCFYAVAQPALLLAIKERWRPVQSTNEVWKWTQLRRLVARAPERPLVLMLGSSRTAWAFRASRLDGMPDPEGRPLLVYNGGVPATGAIHQWLYVRDRLAEGIRPRLLLLEYLPPLLRAPQRGLTSEEGMLEGAWLSPRQLLDIAPYLVRPRRQACNWLLARLATWSAFRGSFHGELQALLTGGPGRMVAPIDERGWRIQSPEPLAPGIQAYCAGVACTMYREGLARFRPGAGPIQALRDLIALCRREQIRVALVVMPESSEFRSWYSPEATATAGGLLEELRGRYGVEVIDARQWLADEDFEDGHHALTPGAEKFTARLGGEIRRLLAR
jgi:hypothetical protein